MIHGNRPDPLPVSRDPGKARTCAVRALLFRTAGADLSGRDPGRSVTRPCYVSLALSPLNPLSAWIRFA
jgi:hypothetical protein